MQKLSFALAIAAAATACALAQTSSVPAQNPETPGLAQATQPVLNLLVPPAPVPAGSVITVNLVALNPVDYTLHFVAPATLQARLVARGGVSTPVTLQIDPRDDRGIDSIGPRGFASCTYTLLIPAGATGVRTLTLAEPAPVRAILEITPPLPPASVASAIAATSGAGDTPAPAASPAPLDNLPQPPSVRKIKRSFAGNFFTYEPIYFIYGPDKPAAKFQFSFAYRILDDEGYLARSFPVLKGLCFAYTQRSLWDITADSSPFYDTSYMPEFFCAFTRPPEKTRGGGFIWHGWRAGFGHESNGRDGADSRSMNKIFARAMFSFGNLDGWRLIIVPRAWGYVGDMSDNPDLNDYRGHADLSASFGKNNSVNLSVLLRAGQSLKYGAMQIDLTYPLDALFKNFAGFFHLQYWNGHGESLLNYDRRSHTIRLGISVVR